MGFIITGITEAEFAQLEALGATTLSAVQWAMLGSSEEWTDWTPTLTGDADLSGYDSARYFRFGKFCSFIFNADNKNVTTGGSAIQITLPFAAANTAFTSIVAQVRDGANWIGMPYVAIQKNTNYFVVFKTVALGAWAGTETGVYIRASGFFEIA